jgi:predicted nucleic acid-binding protein
VVRALIDTCVLSEIQRPKRIAQVRTYVEALDPEQMFLSVVTMGELAKGIAQLPTGSRKRELSIWQTKLEQRYADHVLAIDLETARLWGELTARAQANGVQVPVSDGLIAATALRRGLHVLTRNTRHFAATGALVIDPWAETAEPPLDS